MSLRLQAPREPIALARLAAMAVANVGKLEGLEPVRRGMRVDVGAYRQPIELAMADLARTSAAVQREARELEATQVAKDTAMSAYDARFMAVARCLEGLYRLAGEAELADRVRPSLQRPGRTASDASAEPEAEPEPTAAS